MRLGRLGLAMPLSALLALVLPAPVVPSGARSLADVKSWAVYYGGDARFGADLARFDLVVLDPGRCPPLDVVRSRGARVLMYVSLGEINVHHAAYASIAGERWVLEPNPNWPDARGLDVRDPAYGTWLLAQVVAKALALPVDGVFLDTADSAIERERVDPRFAGMTAALERHLRAIRDAHPRALLVLNGGLPLAERLGRAIDAVALESIWTDYDVGAKRYLARPDSAARSRAALLKRVGDAGRPLLTLEYTPPDDRERIARVIEQSRRHGFVPYVSTIGLDRVFTFTLRDR